MAGLQPSLEGVPSASRLTRSRLCRPSSSRSRTKANGQPTQTDLAAVMKTITDVVGPLHDSAFAHSFGDPKHDIAAGNPSIRYVEPHRIEHDTSVRQQSPIRARIGPMRAKVVPHTGFATHDRLRVQMGPAAWGSGEEARVHAHAKGSTQGSGAMLLAEPCRRSNTTDCR